MEQNKGKNKQNQESENSDTFQSEKKSKHESTREKRYLCWVNIGKLL